MSTVRACHNLIVIHLVRLKYEPGWSSRPSCGSDRAIRHTNVKVLKLTQQRLWNLSAVAGTRLCRAKDKEKNFAPGGTNLMPRTLFIFFWISPKSFKINRTWFVYPFRDEIRSQKNSFLKHWLFAPGEPSWMPITFFFFQKHPTNKSNWIKYVCVTPGMASWESRTLYLCIIHILHSYWLIFIFFIIHLSCFILYYFILIDVLYVVFVLFF